MVFYFREGGGEKRLLHTDIDRNSGKICLSFKRKRDAKEKELFETKFFYFIVFFFSFPPSLQNSMAESIMKSNKNSSRDKFKVHTKDKGRNKSTYNSSAPKEMRSSATINARAPESSQVKWFAANTPIPWCATQIKTHEKTNKKIGSRRISALG